jgi:protein phosphatase
MPLEGGRGAFPTDALVLFVGPSGAGKTTWAAERFDPRDVLESDAFRALVAGDAADQSANADAFRILHATAAVRLKRGLFTVVDATNLTPRARRSLVRLAERFGRPAVAVAFAVSLQRCLAQNAVRADRSVPESVVRRHHEEMQAAMRALPGEGYRAILTLLDVDIPPS